MPSHRAFRRTLVLVSAASVLALSLPPGIPGAAPAVSAADPVYPSLSSTFGLPLRSVANAGVVDLVSPELGEPANPTPASVTGEAGPTPLQSAAILRADLADSPLADTTLVSLHLERLPIELPLSTIPITRSTVPHTWQELLIDTPLEGIPLQAVTWTQVAALADAPDALDQVSMAEVDWSRSVLADLPLAALTFGGADITTVEIPLQPGESAADDTPAERWCYLLNLLTAGSCTSPASLTGQTLIGLSVEGAPLKNIPLKNIPLKNIDLEASPLKNIPLKNIVLDVAPLKNIPLKNIDLEASPLKNIPLKNIDLGTSPLKNIPLKNIAWETSPLKNIPLKNIDLEGSPLKNIPLKNIDFELAPLKNIPLKNIELATSPLKNIPLKNIDFGVAPLKNIPLKNIDLSTSPLKNIPLKNIAAVDAPLKNIPLKNIDFGVAPLKNIPLKNIDLVASGLGGHLLAGLDLATAPLGARPAADFDTSGAPFAASPASGATLAQVAAAGGFTAGATLQALLIAQLTGTADILLGDLRVDLATGGPATTLGQLLAALAASEDPTLEALDPATVEGDPDLGDLRLDLLGDTGITVGDLLAILAAIQPDVLLGDLRLDLAADAPALTLAEFVASLDAATEDAVTLGDLRLDLATGVDTLVLDALISFLLVPDTFDAYLLGALTWYTEITGRDITLGDLGTWAVDDGGILRDLTLGEIAEFLDDSVSLADVLLGLVPPADFPYESFPITSLGLSDPGRYIVQPGLGTDGGDPGADLVVRAPISIFKRLQNSDPFDPSAPVRVYALLTPGSTLTGMNVAGAPAQDLVVSTDPDGRVRVAATVPSIAPGLFSGTTIEWLPGLSLGSTEITFGLRTMDDDPLAEETVDALPPVEDGAEPNSPGEPFFHDLRIPSLPVNPGDDPYVDALVTGFVSRDDDIDWYRLPGVPAGSRISAELTNLPVDADLVLYGPAGLETSPTLFPASAIGLPGALVEDPGLGVGSAATSLAAQALADLRLDQGWQGVYAPDFFPAMTPLSISQHRGSDAESVGAIAPVAGDYVVAVSGYNGATSINPYLLRAKVTSPAAEASCRARIFPNTKPAPGAIAPIPAGTNALVLTSPSRLESTHGVAGAATIDAAVDDLLAYLGAHSALGVQPAVVTVDAYPAVAAAYDAWDADPCSVSAANGVVKAITGVLSDIRSAHPGLAFVTVLGGDDIVPMARVADLTRISNEAEYASVFGDELNPLSAAQAGGFTLTDDALGDPSPIAIGDGSRLFVPRLAVGRLVESPAEIANQLLAFGAQGGVLDTGTALVAGYDFLADGAGAVATRLGNPGRAVDDTLIDGYGDADPWDGADLLGGLFPAGEATPLVASVNAHYDHNALQPSAEGSDIVTATQVVNAAGAAGGLAGRVLFTMGCHAGLAVPAAYVDGGGPAADDLRLDWAETLSGAGVAVYVANTGYGIGDTVSIAYSERLLGLYARLLDGSLTAGQALAFAKQAYYGSLGAVGVYDLKILQQTTFYGLPFWGISTAAGSGRVGDGAPGSGAAAVPSLPGPLTTDPVTGLQVLDHTVEPTLERRDDLATGRGSYWVVTGPDGDEDPLVTHHRPIQPQTTTEVAAAGLTAHGALVTSLQSHDVTPVDPVIVAPAADLAASAPEIHTDDAAWPARMAVVTTYQAPGGRAQDLVLVPGQFLGSSDGTGTQRLFDRVGVRVLYTGDAIDDFAAPAVDLAEADGAGSEVAFRVEVDDPATTRVLVGYHDFDGAWRFEDLALTGTGTWTGTSPVSRAFGPGDVVTWFVQAVDDAGNVGTASGKAPGFLALQDTVDPEITFAISPVPNPAGWVAGPSATVTFTCTDGGSGIASGDCPAPVIVTAQGTTEVAGHVTDRAGNEAAAVATVKLDSVPPSISASADPSGWSGATSATVTFTCFDGGSGLSGPCPDPVTVTGEGATEVSGSVTDIAGNTGTAAATVQLDRTAPSITATVAPAANAAGWHRAATVTVSFSCEDAASGIAPGACPAPVEITTDGTFPITRSVADRAGHTAEVSLVVQRDRTDPVLAFTGAPVITGCTTTDALSGVKTAGVFASSTARVAGLPTTTATCSNAEDVAGNTASASTTYVAPFTVTGFLSPVDNAPTVNTGQAGRTYPIKFKLTGVDGLPITVLPAVTSTTHRTGSSCSGLGDTLESQASGNSVLTFDSTTNTFQYNWKTPNQKGCYEFRLGLADGTVKTAIFSLK